MYGSNITLPATHIGRYAEAIQAHGKIKPIRGRSDTNTRPLARRSNDNLTIRVDDNGDVVVKFYHTEIITYHPDDSITLIPYASSMTNRVVWSILGPHVNTMWSDRAYPAPDNITEVGGRYYHTPNSATIQRYDSDTYQLVGGAKPFEVPKLDRKAGRQALRDVNFYTFQTWLDTLVRLGHDPRSEFWRYQPFDYSPGTAYKYLMAGEDGWREIVGRMSRAGDLDREYASLRKAVYHYYHCYETHDVPYFESYNDVNNAIQMMKRHG
jgi:hypothetical protein